MDATPIAGLFPIFYITHNTEDELAKKIKVLASPINVGDGNAGYSDAPFGGYGILFSPEDKKYQYATDYDTDKKLVIECTNPLSEEQVDKILQDFLPFGQDILFNRQLNAYCYFVGNSGEDLTKTVILNNRRKVNLMKRNLNANQVQLKKIPVYNGLYTTQGDTDYMSAMMPDLDAVSVAMLATESLKAPIKEGGEASIDYFPTFKIELYGVEDDERVANVRKVLKKKFGVAFAKADQETLSHDEGAGRKYFEIICSTPMSEETLEKLVKGINNYAKIATMSDPELSGVRVRFYDRVPNPDSLVQTAKNVTFEVLKNFMKIDNDSVYAGVEDFMSQTEHKPKGVK